MLDALNEAGFEVMSDCRRGECGVCALDVVAIDGEIDHRDVFLSDAPEEEGRKSAPAFARRRHGDDGYAVPARACISPLDRLFPYKRSGLLRFGSQ